MAQPIWRRERKGSSLIELFLFPCTLSRSPFIFKSPPPLLLFSATPSPCGLTVRSAFVSSALYTPGFWKILRWLSCLEETCDANGWNFLRKLCGTYWSHLHRIFHGYLVTSIINVPINLLSSLFKDSYIKQLIYIFSPPQINNNANNKNSKNICHTYVK